MDELAPSFLIAMPDLVDPNFARAVVLLCAHSEDGAFGVVTNRPLSISVKAVCEEANIPWIGDDVTPIYYGGPVEPQRGWVIHDTVEAYEGSQEIGQGISITASHDGLVAYGERPQSDYRLVLGYAGWGPGQLDLELQEGSWLRVPLIREIVFEIEPQDAWQAALRSVGVNPLHLVSGGAQIH
jgi:putative transcriptional regulator